MNKGKTTPQLVLIKCAQQTKKQLTENKRQLVKQYETM